jgi:hypothetical protein
MRVDLNVIYAIFVEYNPKLGGVRDKIGGDTNIMGKNIRR